MEQEIESMRHLSEGFLRTSFEHGPLKLRAVTAGTALVTDMMLAAFKESFDRLNGDKQIGPDGEERPSQREEHQQIVFATIMLYCLAEPIEAVTKVALDPALTRETILTYMQQEFFRPDRLPETFALVNKLAEHQHVGEVKLSGGEAGKAEGGQPPLTPQP